MEDNKRIAQDVIQSIGGKENISAVVHCMTRLRFTLKDRSKADDEAIKNIKGILGVQEIGGQYQVIVGPNVDKVYTEVCSEIGVAESAAIDENLDAPKEKLTPKVIGGRILDYLSGAMIQTIPILMTSGLFRTLAILLGPDLLGLLSAEDPTYTFFYTTLYEAGFYFLPIYLGYTCAKKIGASPVLGMFTGGVLISPTIISAATDGGSISVYGIPLAAANYSQTVLPIVLSVALLYFVEKLFKKVIPDSLSMIFTPFLTMVVVVPISLILLAPIGNELGSLIGTFLFGLGESSEVGLVIAMAVLGALWPFIVMTGMHIVIITLALVNMLQVGYDKFVMICAGLGCVAVWGVAFGAWLRLKNKEEKSLALGYTIAAVFGGVIEPTLFGIIMKYRRSVIGMLVGGAVSSVLAHFLGMMTFPGGGASNVLGITSALMGGTQNFIVAVICNLVAFGLGALLTYLFGFTKEELEADSQS